NGVFHLLADYFKTLELVLSISPIYLLVADKSSKTCIMESMAESLQFRAQPLGHQFHPAVLQIANRARDFKTGGDRSGGVPETDTLHVAGEKHRHPAPG